MTQTKFLAVSSRVTKASSDPDTSTFKFQPGKECSVFTYKFVHTYQGKQCYIHKYPILHRQHYDRIKSHVKVVPGGKVSILGGHSIGHSKHKYLYEHVSYSERFPR